MDDGEISEDKYDSEISAPSSVCTCLDDDKKPVECFNNMEFNNRL